MRRLYLPLFLFFCLFLLTGCSKKNTVSPQTSAQVSDSFEAAADPQTHQYTITFILEDTEVTQNIDENDYPQSIPSAEGIHYDWTDDSGILIDPFTTPVTSDAVYHANTVYEVQPISAFFALDDLGNACPDQELAKDEIISILSGMIINADKRTDFTTFLQNKHSLNERNLTNAFDGIFDESLLSNAASLLTSPVTRQSLAEYIYLLTDLGSVNVAFDDHPAIPSDIDLVNDPAMLCACCSLSLCEDGLPVTDAILNCLWDPGYHLVDGYLYYADDDGYLFQNQTLETQLTFNEKGRYSTGNDELDAISASIIKELMCQDPGKDRHDYLYDAFFYVCDSMYYVEHDRPEYGENDGDWVFTLGLDALDKGIGDCYGFASGFAVLARNLGYDAHAISGMALNAPRGPHSWVIMKIDDTEYFYDPETAWKGRQGRRDNYGLDLFEETMGYASWFAMEWVDPFTDN